MGIMLPGGGLTGNSYGLQHALSPSVVGGFSIDKISKKTRPCVMCECELEYCRSLKKKIMIDVMYGEMEKWDV